MNFKGTTALLTGAASGIGKATAIELAARGVDMFLADINEEGLEDVRKEIEAIGRRCLTMRVDVSDKLQVKNMIEAAVGKLGHIDILVNGAGVTLIGEASDYGMEDWEWIVRINLWGSIYSVHHALPHMIGRKSGHIVNIASTAGLVALPGNGAYCVTKFGLVGFSEVLRAELHKHNIKITLVCPGGVGTNFEKNARVRNLSKFVPGKFVPGRIQTPEDLARKIANAIQKEKFMLLSGFEGRLLWYVKRFIPWLYYRIELRLARKLEKLR